MVRHTESTRPGWRWDDDWRKVKVMEWLTTPVPEREPSSRQKLADLLGVDVRTVRGWTEHPQFVEEWRRRSSAIIGSPDRSRQIMDTLYRAATDPRNRLQVQAAKLYLEATNAIRPPAMEVTVKRTTELSDAELDALLAQGAVSLAEERRAGQPEAADDEMSEVDVADRDA
jgi:hypothetical protein